MDELQELQEAVAGARTVVKSAIRVSRGALGILVDLERRLVAFEQTQSQEAERDRRDREDPADP